MRQPLPLLLPLLAATASCDQPQPVRSPDQPLMVHEEPPPPSLSYQPRAVTPQPPREHVSVPDIAPTSAPGVAFNYRYAFRLAGARIGAVQERHAQLCERLTIARCRITGMLYRLAGPDGIEARLELKLDPAIARRFGRESADLVARAGGLLTESEISGVDAGTGIRAAGRTIADLNADLARIEARLRTLRAEASERPQLDYQAEQLRAQIRALRDSSAARQESLATTPMVFHYGAGAVAPDPGPGRTLGQAAKRAGENFLSGITILLIVLVTILPWAAAAALAWWLALRVRRRWLRNRPDDGEK